MEAKVYGEKGELTIAPTWHESETLYWKIGETIAQEQYLKRGKGYVHEIEEVSHCLSNQKQQSDLWSLKDSLNLIEIMDEIRRQVGVVFEQER